MKKVEMRSVESYGRTAARARPLKMQAWKTRGRTALSTRHRAVCRFVSYIMVWDREASVPLMKRA